MWELEDAIKINDIIENLNFFSENDQLVLLPCRKSYATADGKKFLLHWAVLDKIEVKVTGALYGV